jgi:ketosteroid isomerase-like protein
MLKADSEKVAHTLAVGLRGFEAFKHGLAKGEWQDFLALLTDDFAFYFPQGKYQGLHCGKAQAEEFFKYVSELFSSGIEVTELLHVTASEERIVFEFRDEGSLRGQPYKNRVAISWDIRDGMIAGYREYFGSDGKSN